MVVSLIVELIGAENCSHNGVVEDLHCGALYFTCCVLIPGGVARAFARAQSLGAEAAGAKQLVQNQLVQNQLATFDVVVLMTSPYEAFWPSYISRLA